MNDRNRVWDAISGAGIVAVFGVAFYGFWALGDQVVMGFDASGAPRYGAKAELFVLPVAACALYAVLKLAQRAPTRMISLPIRITPDNEAAVRGWLGTFLTSLRAVMIASFVCDEAAIVQATLGATGVLRVVSAVTMGAIVLTVAVQFGSLLRLR